MKNVTGVFTFLWKHRRAIGIIIGSVLTIAGYDHESNVIMQMGEQL